MSNIFDFPPGRKDRKAPGFLNDSVDMVRFDDLAQTIWPDGGADLPARDWSNQELASIYRVRSLLEAAGVSTAVDRGLSDEGDPWCVFCRADGEVFIHLCRIDGRYLLDSPNLQRPLSGASFADLLDAFSDGGLSPLDGAGPSRGRVVRLDRDGNVFLHPTTMLAALVWTILLHSEDIVLVQVDEDEGAAAAEWLAGLGEPLAEGDDITGEGAHERPEPDLAASVRESEGRPVPAEIAGTPRDTVSKLLMHSPLTGVAAGLSTIAIACGFMTEALQDDGRIAFSLLDGEPVGDADPKDAADAEPGTDGDWGLGDLAAVIDAILQPDGGAEMGATPDGADTAPAAVDVAGAAGASGEKSATPSMPSAVDTTGDGGAAMAETAADDRAPDLQMAEASTRPPQPDSGADADDDGRIEIAEIASIEDIKTFIVTELRSIDFGGVLVQATFDLDDVSDDDAGVLDVALAVMRGEEEGASSSAAGAQGSVTYASAAVGALEAVPLADVGTPLPAPGPQSAVSSAPAHSGLPTPAAELRESGDDGAGPHHESSGPDGADSVARAPEVDDVPLFGAAAREFFYYLRAKSDDIGIMAGDDTLVVIDFTAGDDAVFMKWELSHGGTVATLGARSDYQDFDLIA